MGDNLNGIFANMIQGMGFIGCAPNRIYNMAPPNGGGVEATAEGTELTLHSAAAPLTALTLYGKSEQRTTTGAQLVDVNLLKSSNSASVKILSQNEIQLTALSDGYYRQLALYNLRIDDFKDGQCYVGGDIAYNSNDDNIPIIIVQLLDVDGETLYEYNVSFGKTAMLEINDATARIHFVFCMNQGHIANEGDTMTIRNFIISNREALWEPYTGGAPSPSPNYPQEIKSVGDSGTINVTLSDGGSQSQTLPVQTPNGLPGIPVSSGGNYTDADGQQWICDEVDFKRGVYIERKYHTHYSYSEITYVDGQPYNIFTYRNSDIDVIKANGRIMLEVGKYVPEYGQNNSYRSVIAGLRGRVDEIKSQEDISKVFPDGIDVLFLRSTPIETPLSASELAAYAALRTYSPTTVVSNDAGAWMNVGYKATPQPMTMLARKR